MSQTPKEIRKQLEKHSAEGAVLKSQHKEEKRTIKCQDAYYGHQIGEARFNGKVESCYNPKKWDFFQTASHRLGLQSRTEVERECLDKINDEYNNCINNGPKS